VRHWATVRNTGVIVPAEWENNGQIVKSLEILLEVGHPVSHKSLLHKQLRLEARVGFHPSPKGKKEEESGELH